MKRAELFLKIWRECHGILRPGARVAVLGGGISGLHLAYALAQKEMAVTVFEPRRTGGVRIPLLHACHTLKVRAPLWEKAAAYSRAWFRGHAVSGGSVLEKTSEFGVYFNIRGRSYLRDLKRRLVGMGVEFVGQTVPLNGEVLPDFSLTCMATGAAAPLLTATRIIHGWESYFSRYGSAAAKTDLGGNGAKATNYIHMPPRAGFIHQNGETLESAKALARAIHPAGRHALFQGERLTTRDRFPIIGFLDTVKTSPFLFCAMGYHAMTYAPYLAHGVVAQLTGEDVAAENLISTLTPARFLPRNKDG